MLIRKMICCASLLIVMLILGWKMEQLLIPHTAGPQAIGFSTEELTFRSTSFTDPLPISVPFLPREYVRIRHTID
ncbi:hypothetical protein D3C75_236260 [compost metagenome]